MRDLEEEMREIDKENKEGYFLCSKCKKKPLPTVVIFGEGMCSKHPMIYPVYFKMEIDCRQCAEEQNKCQICGKEVKTHE